MRILLVEDDDDIREAMADVLESACHTVVAACHGAEALVLLGRDAAPELILVDLAMPVMNGLALRLELMKEPRLAGIPVVLMTGAAETLPPTGRLKFAAVLAKPFEPQALLTTLARLVPLAV
jgi:CheY-like chemotaxis protein